MIIIIILFIIMRLVMVVTITIIIIVIIIIIIIIIRNLITIPKSIKKLKTCYSIDQNQNCKNKNLFIIPLFYFRYARNVSFPFSSDRVISWEKKELVN